MTAQESQHAYVTYCPTCRNPLTVPAAVLQQPTSKQDDASSVETPQFAFDATPNTEGTSTQRKKDRSTASRTLYVLLALVLGGFGVHNFAVGRYFEGMLQFVFTVIAVAVGSYIVEDRKEGYDKLAVEHAKRLVEIRAEHQMGRLRLGSSPDLDAIRVDPAELEKIRKDSKSAAMRDTRWVWLFLFPVVLWVLINIIAVNTDGQGRLFAN